MRALPLCALCALLLALFAPPARAAIPLCVVTRAEPADAGLRKLVLEELQHHPTHSVVAEGQPCKSRLTVELFTAAEVRYLTARINEEVPVRYSARSGRDLSERLSEALRLVLGHDPVYLTEDIRRFSAMQRLTLNLLKRGSNHLRVELVQVLSTSGRGVTPAAGLGFTAARGVEHAQIFVRVFAAGWAQRGVSDRDAAVVNRPVLRVQAGADAGFLWELRERASWSPYFGGGAGLHFLRFEGALAQASPGVDPSAPTNQVLAALVLRGGVRLLRLYNFDLDLYAQGALPFYRTKDPDSELVDAYTPTLHLGVGVGF